MTTPSDDDGRLLLIKKLLNKAEARGTTEAERAAFQAKATKLIMQWGIDEALLQNADRAVKEQIISRTVTTDVPKAYSYEYTLIGVKVADGLGCRGIFTKVQGGATGAIIVGFKSDVDRTVMLFRSLTLQCTLELGSFYDKWVGEYGWRATGTDRYQAKRGFIHGFARGVQEKMAAWKQDTVASSAPGTDLVLIDRTKQIDRWIKDEMSTSPMRGRRYSVDSNQAGRAAGRAADLGQGTVGNTGRPAVER
jgi:hypothetical protein